MAIDRLLTRALWMEALYNAFPCRHTLWLWARAGNKLRAARDGAIVSVGKVKWPGTGAFVDSLTGPAKPHRRHDVPLRSLPGRDEAMSFHGALSKLRERAQDIELAARGEKPWRTNG